MLQNKLTWHTPIYKFYITKQEYLLLQIQGKLPHFFAYISPVETINGLMQFDLSQGILIKDTHNIYRLLPTISKFPILDNYVCKYF